MVICILLLSGVCFPQTPPSSEKTGTLLKRMGESEEPALRMRAIEGWAALDSGEALNRIMSALTDPEVEVREAAAQALRKAGEKPVPTPLEETLAEYVLGVFAGPDESAKAALNSVLPEFRGVIGRRMCTIAGLESESMRRRCNAAYCLGQMRYKDAEPVLVKGTASEHVELVRACAESLYRLGNESTLPVWADLIHHPDPEVRGTAVEALTGLGGARALSVFAHIVLQEVPSDKVLQQQAFQALSRWENAEIIPILIAALDKNPAFRPLAVQMLRERTGMDIGMVPKDWKDWYEAQTGRAPARKEQEIVETAPPYVPAPLHWLDGNPEKQFMR